MSKKRSIVYLSGPYRDVDGITGFDRNTNARRAWDVAVNMWRAGYVVICPHMNTFDMETPMEDDFTDKELEDIFIGGDLLIIDKCDAVVMLPGWEMSMGAKMERDHALRNNIPVWYWGGDYAIRIAPRRR